jgi:hypothetical protein
VLPLGALPRVRACVDPPARCPLAICPRDVGPVRPLPPRLPYPLPYPYPRRRRAPRPLSPWNKGNPLPPPYPSP